MKLDQLNSDLKHDYIIKKLEQTPDNEKAQEAVRMLHNFDTPYSGEIPNARVGVNIYGEMTPEKKFEEYIVYARDFFRYVLDLGLSPKDRKWIEEHFVKRLGEDEEKSRWLYTKYNKLPGLRRLPHYLLPPYIYDWKSSMLGDESEMTFGKWELKDLSFTKIILGSGGFGYVYLVLDPDENMYALKLFHPGWKIPMDEARDYTNGQIVRNVRELQRKLSEFPKFSKARAFSFGDPSDPWYITDFVDGTPASKRLFRKAAADESLKKPALREYASMLQLLHSNGLIFYDNNWSAMMITPESEFMFVDYDLVTKEGCKPVFKGGKTWYVSEEQLAKDWIPPTKSGDLESFAKMIDHLYLGNPLHDDFEAVANFMSHPVYPEERKQKLPESLADIVEQMVSKPRNNEITIEDFCQKIDSI